MAQDAELRLKVSLDLAFFRQQLAGLGQASAGYKMPVQVHFDRRSIQNELNTLGANIRRRNYFLEVKTNLSKEIDNAKKLADALRALESGKVTGGAVGTSGTFRQRLEKIDTATIRNIYTAAAKEGILAFSEETNKSKSALITALNKAAQDASQGFLNGFSAQNSAIRKAAGDYGDALLKGLRKTLRSQSPSREMFDIGEDAGKGFELGLLRSMELAEQSATRKMRRMLDRLARIALMASGMSAAEISRQTGAFQGGSGIAAPSWMATVPPSTGGGGGGRLLPPGPTFAALGGTAFGSQKYLPTDLSGELKQILKGAAFAFVDALRAQSRTTKILDLGGGQAALPGGRIAGILPPAGGRETRFDYLQRRISEAYARSGLREAGVLSEGGGGGVFLPPGVGRTPSPYRGGPSGFPADGMMGPSSSKGYEALTRLSGALRSGNEFFSKTRLPLAGAIEELAGEFGNATKQVLLYGTAYKGLAFLIDLPNQALNASKSLQTFNNQLEAITGSSQKADQAFNFVDTLATRFNIPLESARQGFVKLYASMAPAGFSSAQIEDLFTGISKASATLGLSSDKVDRVTYAFAQMASKGQLMSEEVSGQLGDVIPGALSIMAEAARMDIATFKKAMEDGVFVGKTFEQVMSNVPIVLENRFGKGAAGAAKTLQGSMNALAISTQKFYESFEPIVAIGAAAIFPAIAGAVEEASNAVKAFSAAMQGNEGPSKMLEGNTAQIYNILQQVKEIFTALSSVIKGIAPTLGLLAQGFLNIANAIAQFINTPIGGFLADFAAKAGIALVAVQLLAKTGIANLIAQLILLARNTSLAGGGLIAFGTTLGKTGIAVRLFRLALTGIVGAVIIAGIEKLIQSIGRMANRLGDARKSAVAAAQAIRSMSNAELVGEKGKVQRNIFLLQKIQRAGGKVSGTDVSAVEALGMNVARIPGKGREFGGAVDKNLIPAYLSRQEDLLKEIDYAYKNLDQPQKALGEVDLGAGKGADGSADKVQRYRRDLRGAAQSNYEDEKRTLDLKLQKKLIDETEYKLALANLALTRDQAQANAVYDATMADIVASKMSAADKELAKSDAILQKNKALSIATKDYELAKKAAVIELAKPFQEGLRQENLEIEKQEALIQNLKRGITQLTPEQEAYFAVEEKLLGLSKKQIDAIKPQIENYRKMLELRAQNMQLIQLETALTTKKNEVGGIGAGLRMGFYGSAAQTYETTLLQPGATPEYARQMAELETRAMQLQSVFGGIQNAIGGIGDAFGTMMTQGITSMIQGTATAQEVFSSFLKAVGDALLQAASQMIATYIAIGIAKAFAGMGSPMGLEGATKQASKLSSTAGFGAGTFTGFASGGYLAGGFQAFADGGMVTGPTLGLIGEGGEPEYVIPQSKMRSAMDRYAAGARGPSVIPTSADAGGGEAMAAMMSPIDVRYTVERINSVDYVTADQFQVGMAQAARQGAAQGEQRTLRRMQMSASTRRRIGL